MIRRGGLFYFGLVYFAWHVVFSFGRAEFLGGFFAFLFFRRLELHGCVKERKTKQRGVVGG